ncbi:MAG: polysaccharide biosynthesis tyrosine autokinase [Isosphaeraceae bacterium]
MDDTPERYDSSLPSWPSAHQPTPPRPMPPAAWEDPFEVGDAPLRAGVSPKMIGRALRRHWWLALLIWVAGSTSLVVLARRYIKPTFESTAWLKIDPIAQPLLDNVRTESIDQSTMLETQVQLITSPDVLGTAILDEKVAALPRVSQSLDPEAELRSVVRVGIQPKTQLILVSMASESSNEAAIIVGTVVESYLKTSERWTDHEAREQIKRLTEMKKKVETDRNTLRDTLERLSRKSVESQINTTKSDLISIERYRQYKDELGRIELDLIVAESTLKTLQKFDNEQNGQRPARPATLQGEQLEAETQRVFLADPDVVELRRGLKSVRGQLEDAQRITVNPSDPVVRRLQKRRDKLNQQYQELWSQQAPILRQQLAAVPRERRDEGSTQLRQARIDVDRLQAAEERIRKQLESIEVDTKNEGSEALAAQFARVDLTNTDTVLTAIEHNLTQLEYTGLRGRIHLIGKARPSARPMGKKRAMAMAGAPIAMLALVTGVCVLLELKSARVADPDDLSARVRVGVIGVVPPLPTGPPSRSPKALRDEKRRVEEFIQSLDHLRVALCCASQTSATGHRCFLITSACGGEGKTTLAAQLAGRCANAGLLTLLIDADLRRPSLGELLEVPEGPGLTDILLGEVEPEAAMVVIGNAGGFHLLPAGAQGHDPARLLQGDRLGQLVAQFRATFDVVIIDAPPVLAVPDALLLGRWTDGAILTVRHDTSRYPLVERANRRLASIGIPVLGAVVNGVRTVETSYGSYHYAATGRYDEPQDT